MIEEQRRILNMMAEGKLSAGEAEALFDAMSKSEGPKLPLVRAEVSAPISNPKYLRVLVEGEQEGKPNKVNVRVPLELIRAGMRLAVLLPAVAYEPVNRAFKEKGIDVDISKLKPEDLEDLVAHLRDLQVDVDDGNERVRVFCE